jgi:voltage-gated potassium channel
MPRHATSRPAPLMSDPLRRARWRLLINLVNTAEPLMALLGIVWLLLLVLEFTGENTPALTVATRAIWVLFVLDFAAELLVAPRRDVYLRRHWLVVLSLALPAVRVARAARLLRFVRLARGVRLLRTVTSLNRGMTALRSTMRRRGVAYVSALTLLMTVGGAAAMYAFESAVPDPAGIHDYSTALWWTAMIMTTMGSAYWPESAEGRVLCVVLALYAFAMFGYVTATLATFFVARDADGPDAPLASQAAIDSVLRDLAELKAIVLNRTAPVTSPRQVSRTADSGDTDS